MSSNFNNAKIINVYYTKGDRKPYDVNGKPIAYIGEEFIGANEATELRFHFGEELDSASAIIVAKRANGDTRLDPLELVGTGVNSYFKVRLNAWYAEYKGKMTIIFKVYNGTVTYDDPETPTQIVSTTGQIIVSDIFNLEVAYAPNASSLVPPFETEDYDDWFFTLSTKLDKAQSITVVGALPTLTGDVYDDRYFYVENEGTGRLYYINGSTAIEVVWQVGTLRLTPTGNGEVTADTGKLSWNQPNGTVNVGLYNDVTIGLGEDIFYYGKASGAIVKGDIVQFAGTQGDHFLIKKAVPAEINANPKLIMGIAKQDMDNNEFGYVAHFGKIEGIDTKGFAVGSFVWFSSGSINNGEWTTTQPTAPNAKILLAVIVKAETSENANNGVLLVRPTIEPSLKELQDVNVVSIANGQVLRWNNSTLRWENTSALTTAEANITDLQGRMTTEEANVDNLQSRMTTAEADIQNIEDGTTIVGKAYEDENGDNIPSTYLKQVNASATYIPLSQKGANNGVVPLNSNGKISSIYLSGEQDDYIEFANLASFPLVGEADIIYCAIDTGLIYRWTGSTYAVISPSLALGTTATTAFRGDLGQNAYDNANTALDNTENIIDGTQTLTNTRITNSAVGTSPLIVNAITSTSANLQEWINDGTLRARVSSSGGFAGSSIFNISNSSNATVSVSSSGTIISRNRTTSEPSLIVLKQQGTGNILELQTGTSDKKLEVDVNGWLYQNGTRLFHQTANVNNTFFGNLSGKTTVSGTGNTAFGFTSLEGITSGSNNTAVGADGGRTITSGAGNTFLGQGAGFNASQLATASNSTGIGSGAYTDKSNQMVFGNASVSEFKFDRNTGAVLLAPNLGVNRADASFRIDVVSTFGSEAIRALRQGNYGAVVRLGRNGVSETTSIDYPADGTFAVSTASTERMRITSTGNVGIGTSAPTDTLQVNGAINIGTNRIYNGASADSAGLFISSNQLNLSGFSGIILRSSNAGTQSQTERMRITDTGNVGIGTSSPAEALHIISNTANQGIRIERTSSTTGAYSLAIKSNGHFEIAESGVSTRMIIHKTTGLVGIGELTPTAQLQVKSEATTRVPLIVDTLVSHNTQLQEWKVNGSNRAYVDLNGWYWTGNGIINLNNAENSRVAVRDTDVLIRRNIADANPALIVNLANSSATGNIQVWQKAGTALSSIDNEGYFRGSRLANLTTSNNSFVSVGNSGTAIWRNIADANPALIVNLQNASSTGNILELQGAGTTQASVAKDGIANFTGTPSNAQTTDYTLVLSDKGKVVRINSSSNLTVTIPLNSSVAFPIDTELAILRYGTGTVSISPTSGVTLNSKNSERKISGQYGSVALKKIGTDEWVLVGSLEA